MSCLFGYWVHNLSPFLLRFPENWVFPGVRWYGLAYILGFLIGMLLLKAYDCHGKIQLSRDARWGIVSYLMAGILIGGKVGYWMLYDPVFWHAPFSVFQNFNGQISGMSSHGGFFGAMVALIFFCRRYHCDFWELSDALITVAPPGIFLGRIANFINGELWGKITTFKWGVIFPQSAPFEGYPIEWLPARHPSQLYEAALEGVLLGVYLQWRFWKTNPKPGVIAFEGLMVYAVLRIVAEQFREPDAPLIWQLNRGVFYSILLFGIAFLGRWYRAKKQVKHKL